MNADTPVTATFTLKTYTLTIAKSGTGSGTVTYNPPGTTFPSGTVVTLTATPDQNSTFEGWSGGVTETSSTCSVTMNADTPVTATFTLKCTTWDEVLDKYYEYNNGTSTWADVISTYQEFVNNSCVN
jgi:hypothetical protein